MSLHDFLMKKMKFWKKFKYQFLIIKYNIHDINQGSTSLPSGNLVSPLSLPAQSDPTPIVTPPPPWPTKTRPLFASLFFTFFHPNLTPKGLPRQDRPKTRFETLSGEKRYFSQNVVSPKRNPTFRAQDRPRWGQDRTKIAPRRSSDRSKMRSFF